MSEIGSAGEVADQALGALRRIGARRGGPIPVVPQLEAADCGAACLAMVLGFHGQTTGLDRCRLATGTTRGTNALALIHGAEQLGLRGRGVRLEIEGLRHLPRASILHWDFNHFVVFDRLRGDNVEVIDPAHGRRSVPLDRFRKHFTGIALVFEPTDRLTVTAPGRSKVWTYLGRLFAHRAVLVRVLVTSMMLRLFALAVPVLTAMVVDRVVPDGDHSVLLVVGVGTGGLLLFHGLSSLIRAHLLIQLRTQVDVQMTFGFVAHLLSLPYAFFTRRSAGDLLLRVQSNTLIREMLTSTALSSLLDGALAILYLLVIVLLSPALAATTVAVAAVQVAVVLLVRRRHRELASQDLESQARAHSYLAQMIAGVETLKIAGAESRAFGRWSNLYVDEVNVSLQRSRLTAVVDTATSLMQVAAPLVLLGVGAMLVLDGSMRLGTMLATTALAAGFLLPLSGLITTALRLQVMASHVERIEEVLASEPQQRPEQTVRPPRLSGAIDLRGVSFRYGEIEPLVVRSVDLRVEPGSTVAIVGRSGSGKSTLAALLVGLHRPTEGRILYDGYDLNELDGGLLRRQLGMVPQQPFLFAGSIRDNIALADPAARHETVTLAARRAHVHDDIVAMSMGYETVVSDGGGTLSGCQRQRVALARALLLDPAVVVLDEATSSLDATTERAVMANLRGLRCTRIVIAHRLSTVIHADQIVVMDQGRIAETGTHPELIQRAGVYADLVADQTAAAAASEAGP